MQPIDQVIVELSRRIKDKAIVTTGVASPIPMLAIFLAKHNHAPNIKYINCIGCINPELKEISYSSVNISLLEKKESFIELAEIWNHAEKGLLDIMFFGAVQIDKVGNVNMSCIGDYEKPKVKLPGPAGAVTLRSMVKNSIIFTLKHNKKTFVDKVDFITSKNPGVTEIITNLGVLRFEKDKAYVVSVHSNSSIEEIKENTGFELITENFVKTKEPNEKEMEIINKLDPKRIRYKI
jgi:glutaconate CoA-transferase subunit B